jgi:hypothetical protein
MEEPMADDATTSTTTEPTEPQAQTQGEPADEPLGEGGKKALQAERTRANELERQLNAATAKLGEIERANESALERAQREAREAQEAAATATREALRFRIAAKHAISDEDADVFLTGGDEQTLKRQAERLVALRQAAAAPGTPRPDPSQGASTPPALNGDGLEQALRRKLGIT